jgi:hypothetical protein
MYKPFFDSEFVMLKDGKGNYVKKTLFFCVNVPGFLTAVCEKRGGRLSDQRFKVGVDGGLEWEKFTMTMSPDIPAFKAGASMDTRTTSSGFEATEAVQGGGARRKVRRRAWRGAAGWTPASGASSSWPWSAG